MAAPGKTPPEVEECRCLIQGVAKSLADRLWGPNGPAWGTPFSDLESLAEQVGQAVQKRLLGLALSRQANRFLADLPADLCRCPGCGRDTLPQDPEPRIVQSLAGEAEWLEPHRYCPRCRKAFFPQSKSLGIDHGHYSCALLDLISYAGANNPSFREASQNLGKVGRVSVHEKQVERLTKRTGCERLAERDQQVEQFLRLPLGERCAGAPGGVVPPGREQVAVVMADAGMLQLRDPAEPPSDADTAGATQQADDQAADNQADEDDEEGSEDSDQDKPPPGRHWHEDKVGLVLTMRSQVSHSDPCPQIPDTFLDPDRVARMVRGLKKSAPLTEDDQEPTDEAEEESPDDLDMAEYKGPKWERRQVVASRQSGPLFGPLLAAAAWLAGFGKAQRKAFVADGARAIWRVWKTRFSSYVPILDFIHALSYVCAASKAMGENAAAGWELYAGLIRLVWQGKVSEVIEVLQRWQKEHGEPGKGEPDTSPRKVVARTLGYLKNNQKRMKYDEYRKQGLPIVSSLVESMVKQIGRRVKGTEKFWGEEGAEAVLQLRADYLSDGDVMAGFWQRRQADATGQRHYRTTT
jgi:hypothetical protein